MPRKPPHSKVKPRKLKVKPKISSEIRKHDNTNVLELFFDLVFVFAISQLSHHLGHDLSWHGAAETLVLLISVFWVWAFTSWIATVLPPENKAAGNMMLVVMVLSLFMNASIPSAFEANEGWRFVGLFLTIQIGRTLWTIIVSPNTFYRQHFTKVLLWLSLTTPLWVIGAFAEEKMRLALWAIAAICDLVGTWLAHQLPGRWLHSENIAFDAEHVLERCRLFLIIALGETILTTGTAISRMRISPATVIVSLAAIIGIISLWSLSFGRSHKIIAHHMEKTADPIRAARHSINALMAMVAGLIAIAVANEHIIEKPHAEPAIAIALLLGLGPVMFLTAQAWYLRAVPGITSRRHMISIGILLTAGLTTIFVQPALALIIISLCLSGLAVFHEYSATE